jgi:dolichol kinase
MSTLALEARPIVLELHDLLRDLDPARWRDDMETALRARLEEIRESLLRLRTLSYPDEGLTRLQSRISEIEALLAGHRTTLSARAAATREDWEAFRAGLQPAYEAIASSLRRYDVHVPALRPTNYRRNVLHVSAGLGVAALIVALPSMTVLRVLATGALIYFWTMELLRHRHPEVNARMMALYGRFSHPHEEHRLASSTWFCTSLFVLAMLGSAVAGVAAVLILGLADPAAALVGRRYGKIRLVHGRSLEGTLSFVVTGTVAAFLGLVLLFPSVGAVGALAMAAAAAVVGGVAELFSRRVDDNLSIPVCSALAAWGVALLMGLPLN